MEVNMHIAAQRKFKVALTPEERTTVTALIRKGTAKARTVTRARILLLTHEGNSDKTICKALGVVRSVVYDVANYISPIFPLVAGVVQSHY